MAPKPFSGRKKKLQLQERKIKKSREGGACGGHLISQWESEIVTKTTTSATTPKPHELLEYQEPLIENPSPLRICLKDFLIKNSLPLPQRPPWSSKDSLKELEERENKYITSYLKNLQVNVGGDDVLYERNLEVWRQLWRVVEKSDILVIVCDARYPILPLTLFSDQPKDKKLILAFMKCDLVSDVFVNEWKLCWSTMFKEMNLDVPIVTLKSSSSFQRISTKAPPKQCCKVDSLPLLHCLMELDSTSELRREEWKSIISDGNVFHSLGHSLLTIGVIGSPNAGKSSLINCLFGKKMVSSSRTPGHTKHFQTMHLSNCIRLCDSPGIIFPFKGIKKPLQVLMGLYNVAQLRDPFSVLLLYSSHYKISITQNGKSLMDLLEEMANAKGFLSAKGKADIHRMASLLIRQIVSGEVEFAIGVNNK